MKFINNNLKVVIAFVLGLIISGIGVYAITINSTQIVYVDGNNNETTVKAALDNVYNNLDTKMMLNTFGTTQYASSQGDRIANRTATKEITKGKYIVVDNKAYNWMAENATWPAEQGSNITNTRYNNLSCTSGNCVINHIGRYYNRVLPSTKYLNLYHQIASFTYVYYVEIKENTDTISAYVNDGANSSLSQTETLIIIPIN